MKNKVIIITGASSGIGLACVYEFASRGAKIVLSARNIEKLQSLKHDLNQKGTEVLAVKTDISKEEDCKHLIDETINHFGKIDILINNAGISMRALFHEVDLEVIKQLMDTNFWGTVNCTKYALPHLIESKGTVAGIISIAGYIGLPGRTGYSASKYAIRGFLEALRIEYIKKGLHILIVAPGFTASNIRKVALLKDGKEQGETPRNEAKMMSAERCAQLIAKGVVKRKRNMILTLKEGRMPIILKSILPSLSDKILYKYMSKESGSPIK